MSATVTARAAARHAEGDVAGAAGHVEDLLAGARLHPGDEAVLPQPVHAARHGVVHQVVAARDRAEDLADAARLLLGADQLVAEGHLVRHGLRGSSGRCSQRFRHIGCAHARASRSRDHRPRPCAASSRAAASRASRRAAPILRRPFPPDLGQRLTGARVTGLGRRAKYGLIDTDRGDTHGLPPRHVGPLADRSGRGSRSTIISCSRPTRARGSRSTIRGASARSIWCRPSELAALAAVRGARARAARGRPPRICRRRLAGRSAPIKLLLLDQRIVAGLGNIYVCEALHPRRHPSDAGRRIDLARAAEAAGAGDPRRARRSDRGGRLDAARLRRARRRTRLFLRRASRSTTARASRAPAAGRVRRIVQGGRSTFYCPQVPA